MSFQITEAFVNQFSANFYELGQQVNSRLRPYCEGYEGIVGQSRAVERVGRSEAYDITSRHADTRYVEVPHSRRWIDLQDKAWAELVDEMDEIKILADPKSKYPALGIQALNRAMDDIIINAARGTARTGTGTQTLPAAQTITEGGSAGLTLAKLLTAKELLDSAEIQADEGQDMTGQGATPSRVMVVSAKQLTNLYGTTEIKSVDYNNVKALSQGQVDTFLGFKFIRSERLPRAGNLRTALCWARPCMALGVGKDVQATIDRLPGKNNSVQVYARMSIGAVRVEDEGVVAIQCFE